jgi:PAS domain S-box-containing protein
VSPSTGESKSALACKAVALSLGASWFSVAVGVLVLAGWFFSLDFLKSVVPGLVAMNPATAVTFILAATALRLLQSDATERRGRLLARGLAVGVALVGALRSAEYLFGWPINLDELLFRDQLGPNRMAPNTAFHFLTIGSALCLLDWRTRRGSWPAQWLALVTAAGALLALAGYAYGAEGLYGVMSHVPMALNTAAVFQALSLGILLARPERGVMAVLTSDHAGSAMARRLLLAAVGIPFVLGWLRLQGELSGLYETEFGVSLIVALTVILFLVVILWNADALNRTDRERRQAEQALRASEQRARLIIETAHDAFIGMDADGRIIDWNHQAETTFGWSRDEVLGRLLSETIIPPRYREAHQRGLKHFLATGEGPVLNKRIELTACHSSGHELPVEMTLWPLRVGPTYQFNAFVHDITERKRTEQTIQLYADIVKNVPVGLTIWHWDNRSDGGALRLVTANPAASKLLGVGMEDYLGMTMAQAFPAVSEADLKAYAEIVRTGQTKDLGEIHYGDARVAANYWSVKGFPLPDSSLGIAFENISERKLAQEEIRKLNETLEERVTARTAELGDANRDLAEKNQENEMFVYSVSHDLRSPLVNLQGFSKELDLLRNDLRALLSQNELPAIVRERGLALLDDGMAESIHFIQTAVTRLSSIIDALLRLSRAGRVEYEWQQVQVQPIIQRIVEALQATIAERGATVRVRELPPVWGDPTAVEQVFANLIGNALKYLDPKRPGAIEVGCDSGPDSSVVNGRMPLRRFYVKDNGLGIPDGARAKVFQAFQRVHPEVASGEGMGLAIVRRIVERHRGEVWVESTVGQGSIFFVTLPTGPGRPRQTPNLVHSAS